MTRFQPGRPGLRTTRSARCCGCGWRHFPSRHGPQRRCSRAGGSLDCSQPGRCVGLGRPRSRRRADLRTPAVAGRVLGAWPPAAAEISEVTVKASARVWPDEVLTAWDRADALLPPTVGLLPDDFVVRAPRGPLRAGDYLATRVNELVVHSGDLSRSLPDLEPVPVDRRALAVSCRMLTTVFGERNPGHSVEVRVPPFAAVQAIEGPRHTRGTPANVVETGPATWVLVAAGRLPYPDAVAPGLMKASGLRADLGPYLPLFWRGRQLTDAVRRSARARALPMPAAAARTPAAAHHARRLPGGGVFHLDHVHLGGRAVAGGDPLGLEQRLDVDAFWRHRGVGYSLPGAPCSDSWKARRLGLLVRLGERLGVVLVEPDVAGLRVVLDADCQADDGCLEVDGDVRLAGLGPEDLARAVFTSTTNS